MCKSTFFIHKKRYGTGKPPGGTGDTTSGDMLTLDDPSLHSPASGPSTNVTSEEDAGLQDTNIDRAARSDHVRVTL